MKIEVVSCSKIKDDFISSGSMEYLKRFPNDFTVDVTEYKNPTEKIFKKEAGRLLVLLDEHGKDVGTREFADFIREKRDDGIKRIVFAIGPAEGWSQEHKDMADMLLSLSALTFPYQLSQLILIEQIYRAYTVIYGIPYHK